MINRSTDLSGRSSSWCGIRNMISAFSYSSLMSSKRSNGRKGNIFLSETVNIDSRNCYVQSDEGIVALCGIEDLIVIRKGSGLLICKSGESQKVREITKILEDKGLDDYL